jgi:hypothetical protein
LASLYILANPADEPVFIVRDLSGLAVPIPTLPDESITILEFVPIV